MRRRIKKLLPFLILLVAGCAPTKPVLYRPPEPGKEFRYREVGLASWYGEDFHGRRTANGEIYDMYAMTAAHRTLPFNIRVRVTNLENGKKADFRINDRGPFVSGRIIDLSKSGARELGILDPGTAKVAVEATGWVAGSSPAWEGVYAIQVGSFAEKENAYRFREDLARKQSHVHVVLWESNTKKYYRVRLGSFRTEEEARRYFEGLKRDHPNGFIVRED
ncbi:MAG TPA: septal ring lytic transglycosylase RlpA family protein [Thermodesulfobacteriota bacterium]|nr:septal ring lytic transglycosylase RlpA family protein [Thermodesulfobacteriota bacterium]